MTIPLKPPEPSPPKPKLTGTQIGGAVFAALAVPWAGAWVGAHTGTKGTLAGTAIGSVLPVLAGWVYLRVTYHARTGLARVPWRKTRPWHVLAAGSVLALAVFVVAVAGLSGAEAKVLHKSLSAAVTGSPGSGTTLGSLGGGTAPSPSTDGQRTAQGHPSPSGSVTVPSGTVTASPVPATPAPGGASTPTAPIQTFPPAPATAPPSVYAPSEPAPAQTAPGGVTQ